MSARKASTISDHKKSDKHQRRVEQQAKEIKGQRRLEEQLKQTLPSASTLSLHQLLGRLGPLEVVLGRNYSPTLLTDLEEWFMPKFAIGTRVYDAIPLLHAAHKKRPMMLFSID